MAHYPGVMADYLDLYDYRLRVKAMYERRDASLASGADPESVIEDFRSERDELFARHPQSALDATQKHQFEGLKYFPYDPEASVTGTILRVSAATHTSFEGADESFSLASVAQLEFRLWDLDARLTLYWIEVYGGGLFLSFVDASAPQETYGGGRYLIDTAKGSMFPGGIADGREVRLDFNYAYNPSCAYNYRWSCPLAPPNNRLPFAVRAGEKKFQE